MPARPDKGHNIPLGGDRFQDDITWYPGKGKGTTVKKLVYQNGDIQTEHSYIPADPNEIVKLVEDLRATLDNIAAGEDLELREQAALCLNRNGLPWG